MRSIRLKTGGPLTPCTVATNNSSRRSGCSPETSANRLAQSRWLLAHYEIAHDLAGGRQFRLFTLERIDSDPGD